MDEVRRFAEDPMAFVPPGPDEERIDDPRFVVTFAPGTHFWSVAVGRLRLGRGEVTSTVSEIRSLVRGRAREASVWTVGDAATPAGLAEALEGLGMEREGVSDVLVLARAPAVAPAADLEVRAVGSAGDLRAWTEVSGAGFGWPAEDVDDERARAERSFDAEREGGASVRLLALDAGRPVAVARVWYAPQGLYLGGAATLPSDRGRGALSALVAAAWDDAVRRETPALVTFGGAMSSPIFARRGFEKTGEIVHLIDRL